MPKHPVPTQSRTKQRLAPIYVFGFNPEFLRKSWRIVTNLYTSPLTATVSAP
ncbi:MAG: hypothetical protein HC930_05350 [Hydrococcus sp. SU_1_0]|nr:hypothetical protein [Hydrococcus sp. SU_1_0]